MRALPILAAALFATPVLAQPAPGPVPVAPPVLPALQPWQYNALMVQQEELRQQMIGQQNRLNALDAQLRAQQSIDVLQMESHPPRLPAPNLAAGGAYPQIDASQLGSIPDSILADSNKKVRDAAAGRR